MKNNAFFEEFERIDREWNKKHRLRFQRLWAARLTLHFPSGHLADLDGKTFEIPADSVILSVGYKSAPITEKAKNVHIIGDACKVGNLRSVIWQAWDVAMKL